MEPNLPTEDSAPSVESTLSIEEYAPLRDRIDSDVQWSTPAHHDESERPYFAMEDTSRHSLLSGPRQRGPAPINGLNLLNVLTYAAHLFVSWGVGVWGLDGVIATRWQISQDFETLVMPAKWTYTLSWSPILVMEGIFTLAQLFPYYRARNVVQVGTGYYFFYTFLFQTAWTLFFSFRLLICSFVSVVGTLLSLLKLLDSQRHALRRGDRPMKYGLPTLEYWMCRFPFLLHTGWMVLQMVDHFALLFRRCPSSTGLQVAVDVVALGTLLAVAIVYLTRPYNQLDLTIPIVILWSLVRRRRSCLDGALRSNHLTVRRLQIGIAFRLHHPSNKMVDLYGEVVVHALLYTSYFFIGMLGLCLIPNVVLWASREYCTISVVELDA